MLVEADLPNPDLVLRPSMYAMVRLGVDTHKDAMLIPVEALVMEKANASVFIVDNGKAKKKKIQIGFNDGANVEVSNGLAGSEQVILPGNLALADGAPVTITEGK
jgi:membrane fusion protein (multidrug efflux system)